jgi:hypothetical protein
MLRRFAHIPKPDNEYITSDMGYELKTPPFAARGKESLSNVSRRKLYAYQQQPDGDEYSPPICHQQQ